MAEMNKPGSKRDSFADKVGESLEKAGRKISDMGAPKVGQKIHDAGDKMEKTHQNPQHPGKV
ncbi:hypothetical protein [Bdellovibrio bacteriovorus]|uniref:Uncharacterized protein n=1 Tax=Bdellovibrio bacteriovorus TaxID=959 RepID=A0A150WUN9_BDEBC|nr:hypothetical protein [Bdellovibrio bacteriovorus]KYG62908.1 hypothetical protein AZI87_16715 [Bdellovibrio bacteriovorus]KYG70002.1 hypothetical protein AZI85_15015 [Bdellovibrio bacteriovorus]